MFFLFPLVSAAVGATVGAVATHSAGETDRKSAKYHRQVANKLSTECSNWEKRYKEHVDESEQQINELTQKHALDEVEKDGLRLAIRLQQALYMLMWDIDNKPTGKALIEFEKAVLATNIVLFKLKEEFIQVPDKYFSRNLERTDEITIEVLRGKLGANIYPIERCPQCGQRNRIRPHDLRLKPVCGNCLAELA